MGRAQEPYPFSPYGSNYERHETQKLNRILPKGSPVPQNEAPKMAKKPDPFNSNGGNGGYSRRAAVTDKPNPQKAPVSPKRAVDYTGRDAIRGFKTKRL